MGERRKYNEQEAQLDHPREDIHRGYQKGRVADQVYVEARRLQIPKVGPDEALRKPVPQPDQTQVEGKQDQVESVDGQIVED